MTFTLEKLKEARDAGIPDDVIWEAAGQAEPKFSQLKENNIPLDVAFEAFQGYQPEPSGALRQAADIPIQFAKGLGTGTRMISDVFGASNPVSKSIAGYEDYFDSLLSAESKQDSQEISRILKEAEGKGILPQIMAGLEAFTVAPAEMTASTMGMMLPNLAGGVYAKAAQLTKAGVIGLQMGIGAAQGAGSIKGQIYTAVQEELRQQGLPEDKIDDIATKAQAYNGKNLDQILIGAGLGAAASSTGAEKIMTRLITGAGKEASEDIIKAVIKGGFSEAPIEALQGGQEKIAENVALQRIGVDVPTMQGVIPAATMEATAGLLIGGGFGGVEALTSPEQKEEKKIDKQSNQVANELLAENTPAAQSVVKELARRENAVANLQEAYDALEPTSQEAQKLKLELSEAQRNLSAFKGVANKAGLSETITEAEKQQIELAKAITAPAPKPLPTDVLPTETPSATYGREEQIYDVFGGITRKPVSIPKPAELPAAPTIEEQTAEKTYGGETGVFDVFAGARRKPVVTEEPPVSMVGKEVIPGVTPVPVVEKTKPAPTEPSVKDSLTVAQEAPAAKELQIGDEITIMQVPSVLADTKKIAGVKWDIFNGAKLAEKRAAVRITDEESGEVLQIKQFKNYNEAETYFKTETDKAQKLEKPAPEAPAITPAPVAETPAVTPAAEVAPKEVLDEIKQYPDFYNRVSSNQTLDVGDTNRYLSFRRLPKTIEAKIKKEFSRGGNVSEIESLVSELSQSNKDKAKFEASVKEALARKGESEKLDDAINEYDSVKYNLDDARAKRDNPLIGVKWERESLSRKVGDAQRRLQDVKKKLVDIASRTKPTPAVSETITPAAEPTGISVGNRIKLGKSPQTYIVEEVVPQSEVEKANDEQYYSVKNEKTGEVQVVEKADMKRVGGKGARKMAAEVIPNQEVVTPIPEANRYTFEEAVKAVDAHFGKKGIPEGVVIVNNTTDPDLEMKAGYFVNRGQIVINLAYIAKGENLGDIIDHELGHYIFGDPEFQADFKQFWDLMTPEEKAKADQIINQFYNKETGAIQMEEKQIRAFMQLIQDSKAMPKWKQLLDKIKRWINEKLGTNLQVTDRGALAVLAAAHKRFKSGERIVREIDSGVLKTAETAQDAEYLAAVERGDMETAQRMVDEAAKKAGYNVGPVPHGTTSGPFNEFRTPAYFGSGASMYAQADSEIVSWKGKRDTVSSIKPEEIEDELDTATGPRGFDFDELYAGKANGRFVSFGGDGIYRFDGLNEYGDFKYTLIENLTPIRDDSFNIVDVVKAPPQTEFPRIIKAYLKLENPAILGASEGSRLAKGKNGNWDQALYDRLVAAGNDGAIADDDWGGPWNKHYIAFSPNQIKSADPVTYDDAGNVIPLSQRFQPSEPDIRRMAVEPTPIEPEAKTITEGLVQGIDIGKETNMPINNKIESHIKNFAFVRGIFESASDRLRRAKFTKLATAIDDYYDQAQRRLGFANKILLPAFDEYSKQSKATKKKIDEEVKRFFAAQENKRDTAEFFDELNPITQKIVTAWQKFGEESGSENQRIGIKVFDKGLQRWRPIGKVEKFWPRVLKPEYKRALMEPDKYQKEYNEIVDALMKSGRIQTPEEAEVFISDYQGTGSQNDYFSGIESARGQAFPEELYDYSMQVMTDYVARWAQHSSRIEQFGQKLGENSMTLWDKSRASTRDRRTIDYITAAQERVEGYYPNDPIVKGMATLNIWSSGLQLGNPASSMLNFFGGTTLNAMVGQPGALSSYLSSFIELRKLGRELKDAREKGIVSRDLMNIVGDHQAILDSSGLAKAGQKTTDFLLKWSGFTPVEQMVRTQSMIIGKSFLRKTLSSLSKNPNSSFSKQALAWLNRNNIDADKLIVEQGTGPETDRLLRYFANISQGSYTIAQSPIFTDTPIGRFLFKYQKFSTQVMRQSWKNTFEPAWKAVTNKNETLQLPDPTRQLLYRLRLAEAKELGDNRKITLDEIPKKVTKAEGKALTIIPVMMWLGAAYVGGEVILRLRDMLFGVLMKGPEYEDIIKAFEDDEDDDELYLSLERAWYNLIGMGALGLIGNYGQFFMDWQDRERVKNPLDPPALSIFKETGTFIQNAADQGKITVGDVNNYLNRTFSAYRVSQRLYQTAASGLGYSDAPTVSEEMFRREVASINKYARRWASSAGLEYRTKRPMDIAPSKMTPINREIASYLQRGEPGAAAAYAKEYLKSLPKKERANAIQSMESGARNRQPLRLGSGPMDKAEKIAFKKWLKEKVSKEKFDEIQKLESQYQKNYNIFLNNLPNK